MDRVVIGMDPHKRSVTIEVMTAAETVLGGGRYGTDPDGFAAMCRYVSQFPDRVWAVEGCHGIGHHIAMRLLAAGEQASYDRRKADGKTSMEAMRALKRRLSNIVYKTMVDDAIAHAVAGSRTGPGGQRGNDSDSSATGSHPQRRLFGQATPGPVTTQPKPALPKVS